MVIIFQTSNKIYILIVKAGNFKLITLTFAPGNNNNEALMFFFLNSNYNAN